MLEFGKRNIECSWYNGECRRQSDNLIIKSEESKKVLYTEAQNIRIL